MCIRDSNIVREYSSSLSGNYSFNPDISVTQKVTSGNKVRQSKDKNKRRNASGSFEPTRSQPSFAPSIGRVPHTRNKKKSESIGSYLYDQGRALKKSQEQKCMEKDLKASSALVKEKSQKIIDNMRREAFTKIFSQLDPDSNGVVTSANVSASGITTLNFLELPKEIVNICRPALTKKMILDGFIKRMNELFDKLTTTDKNKLIDYARDHKKHITCSIPKFAFHVNCVKEVAANWS
eukprot:TRINITY_DN12999_c0_g3_i1.p2 TRINITY_DN12999_c0_g3~~TRINITY_DN12999_c0_g3_i1.p2  ORF type:complete len:236 (+),score=22.96 TRINITY_DN12999_c0_g3_i1:73-780(+)